METPIVDIKGKRIKTNKEYEKLFERSFKGKVFSYYNNMATVTKDDNTKIWINIHWLELDE